MDIVYIAGLMPGERWGVEVMGVSRECECVNSVWSASCLIFVPCVI